jgi:hypothetical protein
MEKPMAIIIQIFIALLIAGFIFWAVRQIVTLIPMEPIFRQAIEVLLVILVVAIILFYVVIPLLHMLAGINIAVTGLH